MLGLNRAFDRVRLLVQNQQRELETIRRDYVLGCVKRFFNSLPLLDTTIDELTSNQPDSNSIVDNLNSDEFHRTYGENLAVEKIIALVITGKMYCLNPRAFAMVLKKISIDSSYTTLTPINYYSYEELFVVYIAEWISNTREYRSLELQANSYQDTHKKYPKKRESDGYQRCIERIADALISKEKKNKSRESVPPSNTNYDGGEESIMTLINNSTQVPTDESYIMTANRANPDYLIIGIVSTSIISFAVVIAMAFISVHTLPKQSPQPSLGYADVTPSRMFELRDLYRIPDTSIVVTNVLGRYITIQITNNSQDDSNLSAITDTLTSILDNGHAYGEDSTADSQQLSLDYLLKKIHQEKAKPITFNYYFNKLAEVRSCNK